ncbi:unnamed protein product [Chironomus riparius]|uniref:Uncharacterized protein n=1 Tax=Chironomus riparius TaxID=315576 RepID=A0A9N9RT20_9DIPT|nr:unnamed protein product [Chironomus riparius]
METRQQASKKKTIDGKAECNKSNSVTKDDKKNEKLRKKQESKSKKKSTSTSRDSKSQSS